MFGHSGAGTFKIMFGKREFIYLSITEGRQTFNAKGSHELSSVNKSEALQQNLNEEWNYLPLCAK